MSTIDGYWLSFGTPTAARGRYARFLVFLQPSGGALIGCARNRKSFRHMASGIKHSVTYVYYSRFCKNSVGASLFRFLRCLISRSASSSSSDWSAASCPRRNNLLSVRVPCLLGVVCVVTRDCLRGWLLSSL